MKQKFLSSYHSVTDPAVAQRLLSPRTMHYLAPFIGRTASLQEAARTLEVSLPRLHYQVRRLLEDGLLELVRVERRAGRAVKLYRAAADAFFVPFEAMRGETMEVMLDAGDALWRQLYFRSLTRLWHQYPGRWGLRISRRGDGAVLAQTVRDPEEPLDVADASLPAVLLGGWITDLQLDFEEAKALQRELLAVLERYAAAPRGGQRYLLQLRLAPLLGASHEVPRVTAHEGNPLTKP